MDELTVDELWEECVEVERSFGRRGHAAFLQQSKLRVSEAHIQEHVSQLGSQYEGPRDIDLGTPRISAQLRQHTRPDLAVSSRCPFYPHRRPGAALQARPESGFN